MTVPFARTRDTRCNTCNTSNRRNTCNRCNTPLSCLVGVAVLQCATGGCDRANALFSLRFSMGVAPVAGGRGTRARARVRDPFNEPRKENRHGRITPRQTARGAQSRQQEEPARRRQRGRLRRCHLRLRRSRVARHRGGSPSRAGSDRLGDRSRLRHQELVFRCVQHRRQRRTADRS